MSKDPAFLFYSSDFLTGTMLFSNEQVGKYIRLLCLQHQKGILSEKDMLKICDTYDEDIWRKFIKTDAGYYNQRLQEEQKKRAAYSESRRNNRKKKETQTDMSNISKTYVKHMENENENENINDNENKDKNGVEKKFDAKDALLKMGVDSNLADEWLKVRKNKHLTNTRTAFLKIWREIKKTELTANDCIKAAIEHSWGGFEADWLTNSTFAKKGHKNDESSLTNPEVYKNIKFT
jgi:hypothetical protein